MYTFDVAITDKAGNASVDFEEQTFYVDTTTPVLEITGVENNSANNGDVIPVLTYSDTNIDLDSVSITLTGANREEVTLDGSYATITNGQVFTFANFEEIESVDDIYTLEATLTDMAGNTITESIVFSVNRFGSTYAMSDETEEMNNTYVQNPVDVVVYETNPDELALVKITLFKNNETVTLEEGVDYTMELEGGAGEWHKYIYTIDQSCFADDGVYRITFYSEDASGNIAENTLDTKEMEVSFGVDKTSPTVVVSNLESDTTYAVDSLDVNMSVNDNLSLTTVVVYLDDETVAEWNAEDIATLVTENADYTFTINGASTESHFVKIVGTDAAGNQYTEEISDFYVTTNLWVRYYTNKALFYGSIITIVALVVAGTGLIVFKRKKQEVKTK